MCCRSQLLLEAAEMRDDLEKQLNALKAEVKAAARISPRSSRPKKLEPHHTDVEGPTGGVHRLTTYHALHALCTEHGMPLIDVHWCTVRA